MASTTEQRFLLELQLKLQHLREAWSNEQRLKTLAVRTRRPSAVARVGKFYRRMSKWEVVKVAVQLKKKDLEELRKMPNPPMSVQVRE